MIVLKQLAREFNLDPAALRRTLRSSPFHRLDGRWHWENDDPELTDIREHIKTTLNGKPGSKPNGKATQIKVNKQ